MGCSASRLDTLIAKAIEDPSLTSSSSSLSSNKNLKTRSLSAPLVHHPAIKKGDTHHLVCLTSSTYGSLVVVDDVDNVHVSSSSSSSCCGDDDDGFEGSPDSVINTWELMEGLEDDHEQQKCDVDGNGADFMVKKLSLCDFSGVRKSLSAKLGLNLVDSGSLCDFNGVRKASLGLNLVDSGSLCDSNGVRKSPNLVDSGSLCDFSGAQKVPFSRLGLNVVDSGSLCDAKDGRKSALSRLGVNLADSYVFVEVPKEIIGEDKECGLSNLSTKPLWKHLSEESLLSKMDPNVDSAYQRALSGKKLGCSQSSRVSKSVGSSPCVSKSKSVGPRTTPLVSKLGCGDGEGNACRLPSCEDKVVLYFTSLRGIRKTFEDCCSVRMILRGCRVVVDERDISMDSSYRKELQSALDGKALSLPQLFVGGKHIGGADEVKLLHETGELERLFDGFPVQDHRFVCESCGDARFVPCSNCSGSRKVFQEEEGRTRRCPDCNENGLVRCSSCCS